MQEVCVFFSDYRVDVKLNISIGEIENIDSFKFTKICYLLVSFVLIILTDLINLFGILITVTNLFSKMFCIPNFSFWNNSLFVIMKASKDEIYIAMKARQACC